MSEETQGYGGPRRNDLEGRYANSFQIGHNAFEFVLDFGQNYSDSDAESWHTRILTSPQQARVLLTLLEETVTQYEDRFPPIVLKDNK